MNSLQANAWRKPLNTGNLHPNMGGGTLQGLLLAEYLQRLLPKDAMARYPPSGDGERYAVSSGGTPRRDFWQFGVRQ